MKKIFLTFLIFSVVSCSVPEVPLDSLEQRNGIVYQVNSNEPFTGKGLSFNSDGKSDGFVTVKNGLVLGEEYYYDNGQLDYKAAYNKNGELSLEEYYYENGQLEFRDTYKNGELVVEEDYYENGQLAYKATYKNGEFVQEEEYYENGKRKQ